MRVMMTVPDNQDGIACAAMNGVVVGGRGRREGRERMERTGR
jgi:hypothetical protein